jgi:glucokinase
VTANPRGHGAAPATLGVDLGGTGTRVAALSADGEVLREVSFPTVAHDAAAAVTGLADTLVQIAYGLKVSAVGIGASGPVTPDGLIDNAATLPAYAGVDLCRSLTQATGWSCVIDNDAAAAAVGEYTYGAGRGSSTCLVVTLGTGVGVGVITGGKRLRAGDGTHPEAGHIAVPDAPRPCYCGLARCWEQAASRIALEELTNAGPAAGGPGLAVAAVAAAARGGDSQAARAFEYYGRQVAPGLSTLLTIFRADRVVLGGSVAQYLDLFSNPLVAALGRSAPYQWNPPIVTAELGDIAGAVGAAVLARL